MAPLPKTILPLSDTDTADRRVGIRYQITVSAEVIELISGTHFSTRTTDLGPGGCFVDTLMPLPVGSTVRVRLHKDRVGIEALGTVTYSQTGLGMGVAFDEMPLQKQRELDAWLAELTRTKPPAFESQHASQRAQAYSETRPDAVQRLIRLLVKRGVISDADAAAILNRPVL